MKLSVKGLAGSAALLCGGSFFGVALANHVHAGYGLSFLNLADSLYPGYHAATGLASVFIGTVCAFIDGAIAGALIAGLYNRLS